MKGEEKREREEACCWDTSPPGGAISRALVLLDAANGCKSNLKTEDRERGSEGEKETPLIRY